jgi:HSP20 family protein
MTVMRFDPFRELDRVTERLASTALQGMPAEAFRRGDEVFILLDVPGVAEDDIALTVERNVVSVAASRKSPRQEGDQVLVDERPHGQFARQFILGDNLDTARMSADYDRGVLTLTVPVAEQSKPRQIKIGEGGQRTIDLNAEKEPAHSGGSPS